MTDLAAPLTNVTTDASDHERAHRDRTDIVEWTEIQTEVLSLDALWEHEWDVTEARAYGPQRVDLDLPELSVVQQRVRRGLDIVLALTLLILLAPAMAMIALAVRLTSSGPAIFAQQRPGRGGDMFTMLKFRSMEAGTELAVTSDDRLRRAFEANDFKMPADDARITPLGRFLRRSSLDELPQLINVVKGDMSLVGVRPLLPEQLERRPIQDQMLYKMLRPGMTGLWQITGRSNVTGEERQMLDRSYVLEWSLVGDLQVLVRTPFALLRGTGAH